MRSTTSRKVSRTPTAVFADDSTKRQPILAASAAPSSVDTCRMWPCVEKKKERKKRGRCIHQRLEPKKWTGWIGWIHPSPCQFYFQPSSLRRAQRCPCCAPRTTTRRRRTIRDWSRRRLFFSEYFSQTCLFCCRIPNVKKKSYVPRKMPCVPR
jgi:hypothetical protein